MALLSRRRFIKWAGFAIAAAAQPSRVRAGTTHWHRTPEADTDAAYAFFDADDAAFMEAAVERLIPADEQGPGALHVGVTYYIDKQLCSPWGTGEQRRRDAGWLAWRLADDPVLKSSPAAFFRTALAGIESDLAHLPEVVALHQRRSTPIRLPAGARPATPGAGGTGPWSARRSFAFLSDADQLLYLQQLKYGIRDLGTVPAQVFFETLFSMTIEGFFNAPIYTGNEDAVASASQCRAVASGSSTS